MPFPPTQPSDFFDVGGLLGLTPQQGVGFQGSIGPGASGLGTRQGRIQNNRPAVNARKLIHWLIPEGPIVQMYINPQSIRYSHKKIITTQRTKGGFVLQYWGEDLSTLSISGTTGTSGIEGINVLHDIYRNEQLAFDPFALFLSAKQEQDSQAAGASDLFGGGGLGDFVSGVLTSAQQFGPKSNMSAPTLASMACTVEMYYSGEVYRGFFTDMTVNESAQELGLFNYDISFTVTQKRGYRQNYLAWHRSATSGPSNSNALYGTPHSFGTLVEGNALTPGLETNATGVTGIANIEQSLNSIEDSLNTIF